MTSNATTEAPAEISGIILFYSLNGHVVTLTNLLFCFINIVVSTLTLTLNGLALDTMLRQGTSREPADLLVAGLAATDALTGVFVLWVTVYTVVNFQSVWECLTRLGLAHSMMITGMLHLLGLTVDRYLKIVTPYRYQDICLKWTVWVSLAAIWLLGVTLGSLPIFGWNRTHQPHDPDEPECTYFGVMDADFLSFFMLIMAAIMIGICVMYAMLYGVARKHARAISAMTVPTEGGGNSSGKGFSVNEHALRYAKTVLLLIGVNYLCFMPTCAVITLSITGALDHLSNNRKGDLMLYTSIFVYFNSLLNPLIYAVKLPAIRRRYRDFFRQLRCCYDCRKAGVGVGSTGSSHNIPTAGVTTLSAVTQ